MPIIDDQRRLVGTVSEFDILASLERGKSWSEVLAQDIMTPNPVSAMDDADVLTLIQVLQANHLMRVPVVDSEGMLIGMVGGCEVLRAYLWGGNNPPGD